MKKPKSIYTDKFKSAKWDEIVSGRDFTDADIPQLILLCNWYAVVETCITDISDDDGVHVAYENKIGDIKALPQIATMKQASAEIRALNKQLGIKDETQDTKPVKETILHVIQKNRQSRAENKARA